MIKAMFIIAATLVSVYVYQHRAELAPTARRVRQTPEVRKVEGKARTALANALQEAADKTKAVVQVSTEKGPRLLRLERALEMLEASGQSESKIVADFVRALLSEDEGAEVLDASMDELIEAARVIQSAIGGGK